jgi:hypothetical protein
LTSLPQDYLTVFVVAFLAVWLILLPVTVRQTLSRWSRLVDQYPDQAEEPLLRLRCNVSTRRRAQSICMALLYSAPVRADFG